MMPRLLSGVKQNQEMLKQAPPVVAKKGAMFDKQDLFIEQIIMNPSASKVKLALKCGYATKSIDKTLARVLKDKKFNERLEARRQDLQDRLCVSLDKVAEEYARIAFLDPSDYVTYDKEGNLISKGSDIVDLKPVVTINKGKYGKGVDLTFYNKMDALKSLRDMFGYDKPSKHAHLLAGNGQGLTSEGLESAIIGLITGTTQPPAAEGMDKASK
jgi:phage terminase small subunit